MSVNETYVKHLQGMVRFATVSNADDAKIDFSVFDEFHKYLEEIYPNIHRVMEKKVIGRANLLFKWTAPKKSDKLPVLYMAHQDVVPEGDPAKWIHPAYSADIADDCIWGRGSTDCKQIILSEMEAVEQLIAEGFEPDYDIYLAYAYNEEVQSPTKGGKALVEYLKSQNVTLGAVFDEGFGITDGHAQGYDGYLGIVNMGEKAYQDYEVYQDNPGGHSMEPGQGTALGAVAKAVVAIEANPFPYRLTDVVRDQLKATAKSMTGVKAEIYADPEGRFEELCAIAKTDKKLDSLLHTTCAVTMAFGSQQSNILPEHAGVIVNCRVLQGDTSDTVLEHFRSIIPEDVQVRKILGDDPEPAGSVNGRPYKLIEEIMKEKYGENVLLIPGLLAGGTDARFYAAICENVYRYGGFFQDSRWGAAHQVNEKIPMDCLESGVEFHREFLLRY